ncbi:BtpA/SgcQ family protein [Micromonospora sp. CPCC 206060]|uniref:BtpA/SgcQ family protein n=1 Tax=Micromonospora sp. CPCC 206060 TaxID=3122406 RepID=UPI002FEFAF1D
MTAPAGRPALFEAGGRRRVVLGVVHLAPLPGTPFHRPGSFPQLLDDAVEYAAALAAGGADGCLVQSADRVYSPGEQTDPARVAAMGLIVRAVVAAVPSHFLVGAQLMRNAVRASLAVAKVAGGSFVRATAMVGATMSTHGLVQPDPLAVAEYRQKIDAWDVGVVADIDSMHFQWLGGAPLGDVARAAQLVAVDAVCLGHRDEAVTLDKIEQVRRAAPDLPVLLAGHTNHGNAARLLARADGAFVSTCLNCDGWAGKADVERVRAYMDVVRSSCP